MIIDDNRWYSKIINRIRILSMIIADTVATLIFENFEFAVKGENFFFLSSMKIDDKIEIRSYMKAQFSSFSRWWNFLHRPLCNFIIRSSLIVDYRRYRLQTVENLMIDGLKPSIYDDATVSTVDQRRKSKKTLNHRWCWEEFWT